MFKFICYTYVAYTVDTIFVRCKRHLKAYFILRKHISKIYYQDDIENDAL